MTAPKNNLIEDKPQMSLFPFDLCRDFGEPAYREGLLKYRRESWREGFYITTMFDALQRHLTSFFYDGEDYDHDAEKLGVKKHHLGGALFCILCMCDTVKNHPELDDRRIKTVKKHEPEGIHEAILPDGKIVEMAGPDATVSGESIEYCQQEPVGEPWRKWIHGLGLLIDGVYKLDRSKLGVGYRDLIRAVPSLMIRVRDGYWTPPRGGSPYCIGHEMVVERIGDL